VSGALTGRCVPIVGDAREAGELAAALAAAGAAPLRFAPGAAPSPAQAAGALALVDACHPFDEAGARAALAAARALGLPRLVLRRRPWRPGPSDRWIRVASPRAAALALRPEWTRVFIALGRARLAPFRAQPGRRFFVRARRPGGRAGLADAALLPGPGPYRAHEEARLLRALRVHVLVVRNAGGPDAWPKMAAARALALPVVLLEPPAPPADAARDAPEALARLAALAARGTPD